MKKTSTLTRFVPGVLLFFGLALVLFYFLMQPPLADFAVMTRLMSFTALVSIVLTYGAYRLGWINRSPRLRLTLMIGIGLSGLLIFINIWIIARLMFASQHDLMLATVLLVFATGISMSMGFFLSEAVTDRIQTLCRVVRRMSTGELGLQVPVDGKDEMAELASAFNLMAANLQEARLKQVELDSLRRDLIAWVSHDLRTPLTSIRAILEALADGMVEDPPTVQRYLKTAQRDIQSLSHLIDELFVMSQMDAGGLKLERQQNSIGDLISDTIESFSELAERQGIRLEGCLNPDVDPSFMDAQQIGRVLSNLVNNALRYTPNGGQVNICATREEDGVLVEVQDSGEGIPPDDLPHVFDRFYRGEKSRNRKTGGSGLGLAIARGIVEAHGGTITAESEPGRGTRIYFYLPNNI
jgi:signal transduction histidine kinase